MPTPFSKFAVTLAVLLVFLSAFATAQTIGSGNTATADPPVPHPNTTPCTVQLFSGFEFNIYAPRASPTPARRLSRSLGRRHSASQFLHYRRDSIRPHRQHLDRPHQRLFRYDRRGSTRRGPPLAH